AFRLTPNEWVVRRISGQVRKTNNLPTSVHKQCCAKGAAEATQIKHLSFIWIPEEGVDGRNTTRRIRSKAGEGLARNLPAIVDNRGSTVGSAECTQILHTSRFGPDKSMRLGGSGCGEEEGLCKAIARPLEDGVKNASKQRVVRERIEGPIQCGTHRLTFVIHAIRDALGPAERSQIGYSTVLPENRVGLRPSSGRIDRPVLRDSRDLPVCVDPDRIGACATRKWTQGGQNTVLQYPALVKVAVQETVWAEGIGNSGVRIADEHSTVV